MRGANSRVSGAALFPLLAFLLTFFGSAGSSAAGAERADATIPDGSSVERPRLDPALELVEEREAFYKVYRVADDPTQRIVEIAPSPLHYRGAGGRWLDVDTTLKARRGGKWEAKDNAFQTVVHERVSAKGSLAEVTFLGRTLSLGAQLGLVLRSSDGTERAVAERRDGARGRVEGGRVAYAAALGGELEFAVGAADLAQRLVLPSAPFYREDVRDEAGDVLVFRETMRLDSGLVPHLDDAPLRSGETRDGLVLTFHATKGEEKGQALFQAAPPIAYAADETGVVVDDQVIEGWYRVTRRGRALVVEKLFPAAWFVEESRQYPVVLDPSLQPTILMSNTWFHSGVVYKCTGCTGGEYERVVTYGSAHYTEYTGDRIRLHGNGASRIMNAWLRFDVSGLHRYITTVNWIHLLLYMDYAVSPTTINFNRVSLDVCSYDSSAYGPTIFSAIDTGTTYSTLAPGPLLNQWHTFDLCGTAPGALKADRSLNIGYFNVGMELTNVSGGRDIRFRDRQDANRPRLIVDYTVECTSDAGCNDNIACTTNKCNQGRCEYPIAANYCLIGGTCYNNGVLNSSNSCQACTVTSSTTAWTTRTGVACNDGNACSHTDVCLSNATCSGTAYVCNDSKTCTTDICNGLGGCSFSLVSGNCLIGGTCYARYAQNPSNSCQECRDYWSAYYQTNWGYDDNNVCNDGNACSHHDHCFAGSCRATGYSCDDSLACTSDACTGNGGCTHTLLANQCLIANTCYAAGAANPLNPCQICTPATSTSAWSNAANGSKVRACYPCGSGTPGNGPCRNGTQTCWNGSYGSCGGYACPVTETCNAIDDDCNGIVDNNTGAECDDNRTCTADSCTSGSCRHDVIATACLIGGTCYAQNTVNPSNPCEICNPASARTAWSARPTGTACPADAYACTDDVCNGAGTCHHPVSAGKCLISGQCYNDGAASGACLECEPSASQTGWSYMTGKACNDGQACTKTDVCRPSGAGCGGTAYTCSDGKSCTNDVCNGNGTCSFPIQSDRCLVAGVCYNVSARDPSNDCKMCTPSTTQTAFTNAPSNTSCASDGLACTADICDGAAACTHPIQGTSCVIGGQCRAYHTAEPANECRWCEPATTRTAWTSKPSGMGCTADAYACTLDQCNGSGTCGHPIGANACLISGVCYATGAPNPANECQWCDPTKSTSGWTAKPSGATCTGDAYACTSDVCNGASACTHPIIAGNCLIAGTCFANNALNPSNSCQKCANPGNPTGWTALASGAACSGDVYACTFDVCNASATCTHPIKPGQCLISGVCYATGAENGKCQECQPGTSTTAWTYMTAKVCDDENDCSHTDRCRAGGAGCGGTAYTCDDGKGCTDDTCNGAGGCVFTRIAGWCLIGETCYSDDTRNPANDCQWCDPGIAGTAWTNMPSQSACKADSYACTYDVCNGAGACTHPIDNGHCVISATCRAANQINPANSCQACRPTMTQTAWSNRNAGSTCADDGFPCTDNVCNATGTCTYPIQSTKCLIAGQCRANAEVNPGNECEWCAPPRTKTAWTGRPNGTACTADVYGCTDDICNGSGACTHPIQSNKCLIAGACYADDATNPSVECEWCDPVATKTLWTDKPSGMSCSDDGYTCTFDRCDGGGGCIHPIKPDDCLIASECWHDQALNPDDLCGWCDAQIIQTAWSNSPSGTACEDEGLPCTDNRCDGAGTCTHPILPPNCLIGGLCWDTHQINPDQRCDWCAPSLTQTAWSNAAAGTGCPDEGFNCTDDVCNGTGGCIHPIRNGRCLIGGTCFTDDDDNLLNLCEWCDSNVTKVTWTDKPSGLPCPDDALTCTHDVCDGGGECIHPIRTPNCLVTGVCYDTADTSPLNQCDHCDPTKTQTTFSSKPGPLAAPPSAPVVGWPSGWDGHGAECAADALSCTEDVCDGFSGCVHIVRDTHCLIQGQCRIDGTPSGMCKECEPSARQFDWSWMVGKSCDDSESCTHTDTCRPDEQTCAGIGYACVDGLGCTQDICVGDGSCRNPLIDGNCLISGKCFVPENQNPGNPCEWCDPDAAPVAWTDVPPDTISQPCYPCTSAPGIGTCRSGIQWCRVGGWDPCYDHVCPQPEACNELDDDCDATTDEDWPTKGTICDGGDRDLCPGGHWICKPDTTGVRCEDGPVAFFPLDEGVGAFAYAAQGLASRGTLVGATWTAAGSEGTPAVHFDGVDDYIDVPHHAAMDATTAVSLEAWVRPETGAGQPWRVIAGLFSGGGGGYYLAVNFVQGTGLSGWFGDACGWRYSNVAPPYDRWTHVAGTYDGTTARLYVDGAEVSAQPCAGNGGRLTATTSPFHIGGLGAYRPTQAPWKGSLDEVAVYTTVLDVQTIRAHARSGDHCDGTDNDCDGQTDEARYPDPYKGVWSTKGATCDGDDYDLCTNGTYRCATGGLEIACPVEDPREVPESCNGLDDDCHGDLPLNEHDDDNDGYMICEGDCDDLSGIFHPNHPETCDGWDNDCDGALPVAEQDLDEDGHMACIPGQLFSDGVPLDWDDCDDGDPTTHKDAIEWCNGKDDDCDGLLDAQDPNVRGLMVHRYWPIGAAAGTTTVVTFDGENFAEGGIVIDFGYGITVQSVEVASTERLLVTIRIQSVAEGAEAARLYGPRNISLALGNCTKTLPSGFDVFDPDSVPALGGVGVVLLFALLLGLGALTLLRRRRAATVILLALAVLWPRASLAECGGIDAAERVAATCADVTVAGCCRDDVVVWCADGDALVCALDCAGNETPPWTQCGWREAADGYDCGGAGADPGGLLPLACAFDCAPQCAGRVCGPDGCGGTCGAACGAGLVCDTRGHCSSPATCSAVTTLACGDVVTGDTTGGATLIDRHRTCASWDESGPERAYAFTTATDDTVAFRLTTDAGVDLDLFLLQGTCDELSCVVRDDATLVAEVTGGTPWFLVVDGFRGAAGAFQLEVICLSEFVPDCAGRQCGPDGGPFDGTCGTCAAGTPFCREETGVCEPDRCYGVPADGCCGDGLVKRCADNRVATEDCALTTPWSPTCGFAEAGGDVLAGWYCGLAPDAAGDCVCTAPDAGCDGAWECGFDSCGDPCGPGCAPGETCVEHVCGPGPSCVAVAEAISCDAAGVLLEGTTTGAPTALGGYPTCVSWDESGPERAFTFVAEESGTARAALGSLAVDLDVFVLEGGCNGDFCVAYGDGDATWEAVAGRTYYLLVDGYADAAGDFSLTVQCGCVPDCTGSVCGDDGCGGSCGGCGAGEVCADGACCVQQCAGRVCGDDGCGSDCGACDEAAGEVCVDGACGDFGADCAAIGTVGCCGGNVAYWCDGGALLSVDCDATCGWDGLFEFYGCDYEGADPTYTWPLVCPWLQTACAADGDCDDSDPGTLDTCRDGRCVYAPCDCVASAECDDGDADTLDSCAGCRCEHTAILVCDPLDCDDGDSCTSDRCENGLCLHDGIVDCCRDDADCSDGDDCTTDGCEAGVCHNEWIAGCCFSDEGCSDGDPCTTDTCSGGACDHEEIAGCCRDDAFCDDGDPCTADRCDGGACANDAIPACCRLDDDCDDDGVCTEDTCVDHVCEHQTLLDCCVQDADCGAPGPCEETVCSNGSCFTLPVADCCVADAECADNDPCTTDACTANACTHTEIEACCERDFDCADEEPCTDDICDAGTCRHDPIDNCCHDAAECDDDDACTLDECVGLRCAHPLAPGCCDEEADCDDGDPCTTDHCAVSGCEHTPVANCPCQPACAGAACGADDGCGGRCSGTCPAGERCSADFVCMPEGADVVWPTDTDGPDAGPDGTGPDIIEPDGAGDAGDDTGKDAGEAPGEDTGGAPGEDAGTDGTVATPDAGEDGAAPGTDGTGPAPDSAVGPGGDDTGGGADGGGGGGGGCATGATGATGSAPAVGPTALLLLALLALLPPLRRRDDPPLRRRP